MAESEVETELKRASHRLGTVTIEPASPIEAGAYGTWTLRLTVGSYGIDEGGTIKVARRFASDWEPPQFDQPGASGYSTATTEGEAKLRPHFEKKGHDRPWMKCLVIDVHDGSLAPGDVVTLVLGDTSQGSPGIRAQTFQESAHEFRVLLDPTNACVARPLPTSPKLPIIPGKAVKLIVQAPAQIEAGGDMEFFVKGEDRWGNPVVDDAITDEAEFYFHWTGEDELVDLPTMHAEGQTGVGRFYVRSAGMEAWSNPVNVVEALPTVKRYWGDLHAQSDATVGVGTEEEYFTFARDAARVDFCSHQGNDFQVTDEDWRRLNETTKRFHEDGTFVVFPGYEWSANSPAGGDRNVFYLEEGQPIIRNSHWQVPEIAEDERTPAHPADVFFERVRKYVPLEKAIVASHVGGRYADVRKYLDEELAPLVEVVSCWGVFEWILWDALDRDAVVGVMCNSDGHKGRPGAEGPGAGEFGIAGGLTCVLAESLTRTSIFAAMKARRCYGTTGARMRLDFDAGGHAMGEVFEETGTVRISASVHGVEAIESLTLHRGRDVVTQVRPAAFDDVANGDVGTSSRVRLRWGGSRIRGRGRRVDWSGTIRVAGAKLTRVETFSFDAQTDGITSQSEAGVAFVSHTTGDQDGLDLWLDDADNATITIETALITKTIRVVDLGAGGGSAAGLSGNSNGSGFGPIGIYEDLGGMDLFFAACRYPEEPVETMLRLAVEVSPVAGQRTPYFVKAVQVDGQTAWSSPVYIDAR